jgi:uncharacterized SAM-binding protein YcdF (DUF218 family)
MMPPVFLPLSKLLDLLLAPLTWALLLLAAAALLRRRPRLPWALAGLAVAVLLAFSSGAVAEGLMRLVERSAVRTIRPEVTYDAVIVLGGLVDDDATRASGETQLTGAAERLLAGWRLLVDGRADHLVYSCGVIEPQPGDVPESVRAVELLTAWGVDPARLLVEDRSRNTRENAVESVRLVRQRGWTRVLLVTSAAHMARAVGCFRALGLEPDTLPVDWRGGDGRRTGWLPRARALDQSTDALRELAGRLVYRVMGYSKG